MISPIRIEPSSYNGCFTGQGCDWHGWGFYTLVLDCTSITWSLHEALIPSEARFTHSWVPMRLYGFANFRNVALAQKSTSGYQARFTYFVSDLLPRHLSWQLLRYDIMLKLKPPFCPLSQSQTTLAFPGLRHYGTLSNPKINLTNVPIL